MEIEIPIGKCVNCASFECCGHISKIKKDCTKKQFKDATNENAPCVDYEDK